MVVGHIRKFCESRDGCEKFRALIVCIDSRIKLLDFKIFVCQHFLKISFE